MNDSPAEHRRNISVSKGPRRTKRNDKTSGIHSRGPRERADRAENPGQRITATSHWLVASYESCQWTLLPKRLRR